MNHSKKDTAGQWIIRACLGQHSDPVHLLVRVLLVPKVIVSDGCSPDPTDCRDCCIDLVLLRATIHSLEHCVFPEIPEFIIAQVTLPDVICDQMMNDIVLYVE